MSEKSLKVHLNKMKLLHHRLFLAIPTYAILNDFLVILDYSTLGYLKLFWIITPGAMLSYFTLCYYQLSKVIPPYVILSNYTQGYY
jgi:hypothetical protein